MAALSVCLRVAQHLQDVAFAELTVGMMGNGELGFESGEGA